MNVEGRWRYQLARVVFVLAALQLGYHSACGVVHTIGHVLDVPTDGVFESPATRHDPSYDYDWPTQ